MGAIGEAFTNTVPAVGTAGTTYASTVNAILTEVMSRLSTKVPVGSIAAAQAALDMNNQAVKNQSYSGFYDQGSTPSGAPYGRIVYANDEFYMVTPNGVVQITDGGAIDVASTGVIGGDYGGANPALVEFVDATGVYEFWDDGGTNAYGIVSAAGFYAQDQTSGEAVRITAPTTIAATYDLKLPVNDPASGTSLLAMTSTGQMVFAEDGAITGALTNGGLLHGDRVMQFNTNNELLISGSRSRDDSGSAATGKITVGTTNTILGWVVTGLPTDARIKAVSFRCWKSSGGSAGAAIFTIDQASGTITAHETATSSTASGFTTVTRTCSTPKQLASGTMLYITLLLPASTDYVLSYEVTYDKVL